MQVFKTETRDFHDEAYAVLSLGAECMFQTQDVVRQSSRPIHMSI